MQQAIVRNYRNKKFLYPSFFVSFSHMYMYLFDRPKESVVTSCLKGLPPTCSLLVIDTGGRVLLEKKGSSQQGSTCQIKAPSKSSLLIQEACVGQSEFTLNCPKLVTSQGTIRDDVTDSLQFPESNLQKNFQKLAGLEIKGASRRFTPQDLESATKKFSPQMVISECRYNKVYKANLGSGQTAAVKVLQITEWSGEDLLQEIEILSGLNHENIVKLIGYCYSLDMHAVVYNQLHKNLKQKLTQLGWSERIRVAVGIAKALEYLHHSCSPPIIHRDVRSSNILLPCHCEAQLVVTIQLKRTSTSLYRCLKAKWKEIMAPHWKIKIWRI
ncbi:hypothetical protein AQUCO_04300076v1 [Aquilegia coerulea]|uniref:Protein kinase domain-containing protein n=1 Tax=Aquilegia coerulea TaxID=218851 RepID=A0A2G5CNN4_AQUCA|nr:hypothetical protein AQUCO_04300076v1 [Aquilegia coerulea]